MNKVNHELHEVFQALSDPIRVRMVNLMLRSEVELCLCDLSESLNEPEYKLSRHIKVLKNSGLLSSVRDGKWIYHSIVKDKRYLSSIFEAVRLYPAAKYADRDQERFQKRRVARDKGRCRQSRSETSVKIKHEINAV